MLNFFSPTARLSLYSMMLVSNFIYAQAWAEKSEPVSATTHEEDAISLAKRALTAAEAQYGVGHPVTEGRLLTLASLYEGQGHYFEAIPLMERAVGILHRKIPPE